MEEVVGNGGRGKEQTQESKHPSPLSMSNHHKFQPDGPSGGFPTTPHSNAGVGAVKFSGVPPMSRYSQFTSQAARSPPLALAPPQPPVGAMHARSRSLSQPPFLSLDALSMFINPSSVAYRADSSPPATSLSTDSISADVSMDDHDASTSRDGMRPLKTHRRSHSDIPFAFFQSSLAPFLGAPPLAQQQQQSRLPFLNCNKALIHGGGKPENGWERGLQDGVVVEGDDVFKAYMNLDGFDSSEDNNNGSKTCGHVDANGNEAGGKANSGGSSGLWAHRNLLLEKKEGGRRVAGTELVPVHAPATRHCRSQSMDSLMGKMNFVEDYPQLLLSAQATSASKGNNNNSRSSYSSEFNNGEFSPVEMKKIMANEKLVEMALTDPKRVKRILANRQSAARSKERKMRYIIELEQKVQALQTETTTLFAQINLLQRDSLSLTNQNNELKFRLQAMEQQGHLRDALNEALTAEVQRLKLAANGLCGPRPPTDNLNQETDIQMFQMQQKQQSPLEKEQSEDAEDQETN